MGIDLGKKIRELRQQKKVTQEQLAEAMCVSPQAVSKWENDLAMPDIQTLPELSVYFGVTIDELFNLSKEARYERIENLCEIHELLPIDEFAKAEEYLKDRVAMDGKEARPQYLLAVMYNHMADGYRRRAEAAAKSYIALEPEIKWGHSQLNMAQQAPVFEWSVTNHSERIRYYQKFVAEHPEFGGGYQWLLNDLIADWRLDEAEKAVLRMKEVQDDYRVPLYQGQIAWCRGKRDEAFALWNQMIEGAPEDWLVYSCMGDCLTRNGEYERAIAYFRKSMTLEPKPRYTDDAMSIAQIYEILEKPREAADAWGEALQIMKDEWSMKEGDEVNRIKDRIRELRSRQ